MFGGLIERMRRRFATQFEPEDEDYIYRPGGRGEPFRVTTKERDRYVAEFAIGMRRAIWGLLAAILLLLVCVAAAHMASEIDELIEGITLYGGIATVVIIYLLLWWEAWTAPRRALRDRQPLGFALSRAERRSAFVDKLSYAVLAGGVALGAILLSTVSLRYDIRHGWGRLWLASTAILILVCAVLAFRKWQNDRQKDDPIA